MEVHVDSKVDCNQQCKICKRLSLPTFRPIQTIRFQHPPEQRSCIVAHDCLNILDAHRSRNQICPYWRAARHDSDFAQTTVLLLSCLGGVDQACKLHLGSSLCGHNSREFPLHLSKLSADCIILGRQSRRCLNLGEVSACAFKSSAKRSSAANRTSSDFASASVAWVSRCSAAARTWLSSARTASFSTAKVAAAKILGESSAFALKSSET
jgi:hypothetical protein